MLKKILLSILVIFIIAQFIRPGHNNGNERTNEDITKAVNVPENVMGLLQTACYDCHSDHTNYPWYSKITPVNWWLDNHIKNGKRHLNFSHFAASTAKKMDHKLDDIIETVKGHSMPISSYLWIHKDANLSDEQRAVITEWASAAREQIRRDSSLASLSF